MITTEKIVLNPDEKAFTLNQIVRSTDALKWLYESIEDDSVTTEHRKIVLGIFKHTFENIGKKLGAEADEQESRETTLQILKAANEELDLMRKQRADSVSVDSIGKKLHFMSKSVYNWWQNLGFVYSESSINTNSYNSTLEVKFSTLVEEKIRSFMEETPITSQAKLEKRKENLQKKLKLFNSNQSGLIVVDNAKNRKVLSFLLKKRFPNCRIYKIESVDYGDVFGIRYLHVHIKLTDVGDVFEKNVHYDF